MPRKSENKKGKDNKKEPRERSRSRRRQPKSDDDSKKDKVNETQQDPQPSTSKLNENTANTKEDVNKMETKQNTKEHNQQSEPDPKDKNEAKDIDDPAADSNLQQNKEPVPENENETAAQRFNKRNQRVTPIRRCSELIVGTPYRILNLERPTTQYGPAIRAEIVDERSPTGRSFLFLPIRFRDMSNEDLSELNAQANSENGLHIIYKGKIGRADIVELI